MVRLPIAEEEEDQQRESPTASVALSYLQSRAWVAKTSGIIRDASDKSKSLAPERGEYYASPAALPEAKVVPKKSARPVWKDPQESCS